MTIREAEKNDTDAMSALIDRVSRMHITAALEPEAERIFLDSCKPSKIVENMQCNIRYHVSILSNEIIGLIGVRDLSHVFHLFVDSAHHQTGLGRKLWKIALEASRSAGHTRAMTVNSSPNAVTFYEKLGFCVCGPTDHRNGITSIPMVLDAS
ncbi:MAG: GNAT family N-acetyltransferase [Pseudomonadota bacterium]